MSIATNLFLHSGDIFPNKLQWTMSSLQNNPIILVMHVALSYEHYNNSGAAAAVNYLVGSSGWVQRDQLGGEKPCVNKNMPITTRWTA